MTTKELMAEIEKSDMANEAKAEIIDVIRVFLAKERIVRK